jgi:hypothetical protein
LPSEKSHCFGCSGRDQAVSKQLAHCVSVATKHWKKQRRLNSCNFGAG